MTEASGTPSARVCESGKQAEEAKRAKKWRWTEPAVWTARMLETLEQGVRGGKWFSLIDKVHSEKNLRAAYEKVRRNKGAPGVDHETVEHFGRQQTEKIRALQEALSEGRYEPQAVRRVYIAKPGKREQRPLGIPTVQDRVVQAAMCNVLAPIFEKKFVECSYGFRPRRSAKDALRQVTKKLHEGYRFVVDADIQSFFDKIDHSILMELVRIEVADGRVLKLIEQLLKQGVLEDGDLRVPEEGAPQGGVLSPLLANIYLHEVDEAMSGKGWEIVRYADDLVVLCRTEAQAQAALQMLHDLTHRIRLILHPEKTKIVDMNIPGARFTFLGYDFVTTKRDKHIRRYPNKKSRNRLRWRVKELTKRLNGHSLCTIIKRLNPVLRGWFQYFQHSSAGAMEELDQYVRRRLRAILAHRNRRSGGGFGRSHCRWPNSYFHHASLFNLTASRQALLQSAMR